ncbi:MAG TPA: DUF2155 domain-containing protein [Beijerinckiaceae bacterium]|jgi:hypothetical protein|nr:DUF2155 domain-containing protein [Beijerinckiaceae bacterium]
MRRSRPRSAATLLGFVALALCASAVPSRADKLKHATATFAGLDKITGRIISFEVAIDETVQFGTLQITPRVCYSRPPTEAPRTDGFVEIYETDAEKNFKKIFSGWMFADSPGLNGVEHPIYDVWLTDCGGDTQLIPSPPDVAEQDDQTNPPATPPRPGASQPAGTARPAATPAQRRPGATPADSAAAPLPLGAPVYVPSSPDSVPPATAPSRPAGRLPPGPRPPASIPQPRYYPPDPDNPYGNY